MKTRFKTFFGIVAATLIVTGCIPHTYVRTSSSHYSPSHEHTYGDGQPSGYYYNPNTQDYHYQQSANVAPALTFNDFHRQLSPHGTWVNIAPYGQVWVANVRNFQPYSTNGYWAHTIYGWTWVSNYSWGWAPFHYGRWGYDNRYGWYWVPGYEWGPAWVVWSSGGDMYGWAPLMPGMHFDVRLTANLFPSRYWTFMPSRYMGSTNIGGYYVNSSRNTTIINNITIINNYGNENNRRYNMGPSAADVQRQTGRSVQTMRVSNTSDNRFTGISNDELRVYRPGASANDVPDRVATTPDNNRRTTPQTGTQQNQPATRPATQTETRQSQSATQPTPEYRSNPAQPSVPSRAAPQRSRQIQNAQNDNRSQQQQQEQQQQRSSSSSRRR
jgi:hypothetical protein